MSPSSKLSRGATAVRAVLTVVFLAVAGWLWLNQQYVIDQITVWQYRPASEVATLATHADMNDQGRFLYYASQPTIDGTQRFNQFCGQKEEGISILGCYTSNRIYIYDVQDSRLDGIREVTAAHEMLHAAYQRMSADERAKINGLLEAEYAKLADNQDYKERMAFYAKTEPGERDNELHSVIGTEVASISPELEDHYKKYFGDRSKVVALHDAYEAVFTKLDNEAHSLYAELQQLGAQITAASDKYNADVAALNSDIQSFNSRATSGKFGSQVEFSSQRADLVARVSALSDERASINATISEYESKRQQYNQLANESKQLVDSLNSKLAPAPAL